MKVVDMYTLYWNIKKKKSLTTKGAIDQSNSFKVSLDSLFDVSRPDAESSSDLILLALGRGKRKIWLSFRIKKQSENKG